MSAYCLACFIAIALLMGKSEGQSRAIKNVIQYADAFHGMSRAVRGMAGLGTGAASGRSRRLEAIGSMAKQMGQGSGGSAGDWSGQGHGGRGSGRMSSGMGGVAGGLMSDGFGTDFIGDMYSGGYDHGMDAVGGYDAGW